MNENEITARLSVLEVFSMTALGLYLANSKNDPDFKKAEGILEHLRAAVRTRPLSFGERTIAEKYAENLIEALRMNIRQMRGHIGQPH